MGLFSFVGKALGKVAKVGAGIVGAGLNSVTHGASGKILKVLKGRGPSAPSAAQTAALVAKVGTPTPKLSRTEQYTEGWGFSPSGYGADRETKRSRAYGKQSAAQRRQKAAENAYRADAYRSTAPKKRASSPAKARSSRKAPSGGLDLKALSVAWRAAGSPGTWQSWIKAQGANYRKA